MYATEVETKEKYKLPPAYKCRLQSLSLIENFQKCLWIYLVKQSETRL